MEDNKNTDVTVEQTQGEEVEETERNEEKIFKQEDVNNIVAKEVKTNQERLLKELGIDDFENAKDGLKKFREWQEEQKTEKEKTEEKITALSDENTSYKKQNEDLKAEIEALKQGVRSESVNDVILLANNQVNDEVTIEEAIKNVLEKYPQFGTLKENDEKKQIKFINGGNSVNKELTQTDKFKQALGIREE